MSDVRLTLFDAPALGDTAAQLAQHLPEGRVWGRKNDPSANVHKLIRSLAAAFSRIQQQIFALARQFDINLTTDLLPDWETSVGIPDECIAVGTTLAFRRAAVLERLKRVPIVTKTDFEVLGEALIGEPVTVTPGAEVQVFPLSFPISLNGTNNARFKMFVNVESLQVGFRALPGIGTEEDSTGAHGVLDIAVNNPHDDNGFVLTALNLDNESAVPTVPSNDGGYSAILDTALTASRFAIALNGDAGAQGAKTVDWAFSPDSNRSVGIAAAFRGAGGAISVGNIQTEPAGLTLSGYAMQDEPNRYLFVAVNLEATTAALPDLGDGQTVAFDGTDMVQVAAARSGAQGGSHNFVALYALKNAAGTGDVVVGGANNSPNASVGIAAFHLDGIDESGYEFEIPFGAAESGLLRCVFDKVAPGNVLVVFR